MARRDVEFIKGNYYHLYNRGAHRLFIFRHVEDYAYVLRAMNEYGKKLRIAIIAYCLLPNHFHWLVRQDGDAPAGLLAQRVYNGYSKRFNVRYQHSGTIFEGSRCSHPPTCCAEVRYQHSGTIFEGRFKVKPVDKDEYLRHLCCYIHSNPVKDGFALAPELWPYSNYPEWLGLREGNLVDHNFIDQFFPDRSVYQQRVQNYLTERNELPTAFRTYLENLRNDTA